MALDDEKQLLHERRADLAKELEGETQKRVEAEQNYEQLRDQLLKLEVEEARERAQLQARIEQLESEKQGLQLKLVRVSDQFEKGDLQSKEKQLTYEEMLQESKRAYVQLDESYKSILDKMQQEKAATIKQFEKTYQQKIKSKLLRSFASA